MTDKQVDGDGIAGTEFYLAQYEERITLEQQEATGRTRISELNHLFLNVESERDRARAYATSALYPLYQDPRAAVIVLEQMVFRPVFGTVPITPERLVENPSLLGGLTQVPKLFGRGRDRTRREAEADIRTVLPELNRFVLRMEDLHNEAIRAEQEKIQLGMKLEAIAARLGRLLPTATLRRRMARFARMCEIRHEELERWSCTWPKATQHLEEDLDSSPGR